MHQDLFSLATWSLSNELYFQPSKCSNLRISRKRISPYRGYSINGIDVEVVSTEKDFGVVIANDTSWKDHILMIVAKANRLLGFIRSCAGIVGSVALLHLFISAFALLLLLAVMGTSVCYQQFIPSLKSAKNSYTLYTKK